MVAGVRDATYVVAMMEQPPFPFFLVALVALFGFLALSSGPLWLKIAAGFATVLVAAAAVYQSRPRRILEDPPEDDFPDVEQP